MTDAGIPISEYRAAGSGGMTVTEDISGDAYTFRVTTRTHKITISDDEAVALAEAILERQGRR